MTPVLEAPNEEFAAVPAAPFAAAPTCEPTLPAAEAVFPATLPAAEVVELTVEPTPDSAPPPLRPALLGAFIESLAEAVVSDSIAMEGGAAMA